MSLVQNRGFFKHASVRAVTAQLFECRCHLSVAGRERASGLRPKRFWKPLRRANRGHVERPVRRAVFDRADRVAGHLRRPGRAFGINKGSELSPVLMNLLLHDALDVPCRDREPPIPLRRYADNLAVLCSSRSEAERCHGGLVELLAAVGLNLKGETHPEGGIRDLVHQSTTLLGFRLSRRNGRIVFQLPESAETLVRDNLEELVRIEDRPEETVKDHLLGWIGSLGPAYQDTDVESVCATALSVAESFGFRDVVPARELQEKWRRAHQGWLTRLSRVRTGEIPPDIQGRR